MNLQLNPYDLKAKKVILSTTTKFLQTQDSRSEVLGRYKQVFAIRAPIKSSDFCMEICKSFNQFKGETLLAEGRGSPDLNKFSSSSNSDESPIREKFNSTKVVFEGDMVEYGTVAEIDE